MNKEQKENLAAMLFQAMKQGGPKGEWLKVDSVQFKAKSGETPFETLMRAVQETQKTPAEDPTPEQVAVFTARVEELVPKVSENLSPVVESEYGADYNAQKDVIELPSLGDYDDVMEYAHDLFMASSLATGNRDRFDRPGVLIDAPAGQSSDALLREQLIGELVAASSFLDYGMPTRLAPDSVESLPAFEKMATRDPKQFQAIVEDFNNAVIALREVREGQKPDFKMIAETQRKKAEETLASQKAQQEKKAKEEEKAKADKEKKAAEMRLKSQAEQKAAERQVALLTAALLLSKERDRVWMNPTGKLYPSFYPKGPAISPFNAISLALHSDANGHRTNLYTTFQEARVRKEGVKAEEKGVPFNWYNWNQYVNRNNPEEKITRKEYLALPPEEKAQYKGIQNREIRTLFNIDQTMTPVVDPEGYGKAVGWNGGNQERRPSPVEEKILRNVMDEFVDSISTNLVSVERNEPLPVASYDIREDVVRVPNAGSYVHYHDYVHDTVSEIVRATGHAERLAREGAVNRTGQDALVREELIVELATGVKMLEMGMPARLSNDSQRLVEDWNKQLQDDPKMIDVVETEVNNALEVMRKAERGEKVVYSSFVNQQKVHQLQEKQKPQVSTAEGLVLADIITHHGMDVREDNFKDKGEMEAFLEKFGMAYYLDKIEYARKMAQNDDPEVSEAAYSEMYNYAAVIDQLAREYRPAEWVLKGRRNVEELIHDIMDEDAKQMVIVYDDIHKKADIILPQGAFTGGKAIMPNGQERSFYLTPSEVLCPEERKDAKIQFSDAPGFSKTRIDHALANDPKFDAVDPRYFNRDGVAGFHADDRYFEGKQVFSARLSSWKLEDLRSYDIRAFVEQSRHPQFDKVLMVKDDDNRWLLYMQPQGEKSFGVYPDKADVNKFFTASHQGNPAITAAVRDELASKYYELAKVKPDLQVNLLGEKASEEDAARLQRVNIFKNKLGQFMIIAKVTDTPKDMPPREITAAQWQRLWLSPDHDEYKKDLAAKIFADLLHPERQQKEEAQQAEVQKPEPKEEQKETSKKALSPLVKQYLDMKAKHPDALLLFRTGDFYETYKEDAVKASNILGITLTRSSKTRDEEGKPLAMAGFPYHALDSYLPRLIRAGQRVAICDQIEAPRQQVEQTPKEEESRSSHFHR